MDGAARGGICQAMCLEALPGRSSNYRRPLAAHISYSLQTCVHGLYLVHLYRAEVVSIHSFSHRSQGLNAITSLAWEEPSEFASIG